MINMLIKDNVLAVMVTYNPDPNILNNVCSLMEQVNELLIIDNCSDSHDLLNVIKNNYKTEITYNNANMGVAYALNQGLNLAKNKKYKLFLTMDQDSFLHEYCVSNMINVLNENLDIVSVGPDYYKNINKSESLYKEVDSLITSGNLVYTEKALEVNGYSEDLFIDAVDFDFSLALKSKGGKLAEAKNAYMDHNLGETLTLNCCGLILNIIVHSPLRHYYMFRNHCFFMKKYIRKFPKYCIRKEIHMWKYFLEILILHPNKKANLKMIIKGIKDAKQSKYGKMRPR